MRPVCLIVRDGWGYNEETRGNAVAAAATPNNDRYRQEYPHLLLACSGEAVGLPAGFQGSSEVGHLNMGAGRVVVQELKRIDDGLEHGTLFERESWRDLVQNWRQNQSRLHLLGLLQDQGVHAYDKQLFRIMKQAREEYPEGAIVIHPFLDGRDTPPRSAERYLRRLQEVMEEVGGCSIGTLMGRYYSMDRSENWELTSTAYHCLVAADGRRAPDALSALHESYEQDKTPDGYQMVDEYIPPYAIGEYQGMADGDCVMHTNYRQDRAIQLTKAFVEDEYPGERRARPSVSYLAFTRYYDELENYLIGAMGGGGEMNNLLGEVLAANGLKQLRIAETQKFRHVTSFFNGKATTPYEGEEQVDVHSRFDPASFASHPEMEAYNVTDELIKRLDQDWAFVAVNYANCDMVGHTGEFEPAKKAVEVVDECTGRLIEELLKRDYHILLTADHGNSEQMIEYDSDEVRTAHSVNPVECFYIAGDAEAVTLRESGKLSDIAPTVLYLLGLSIPEEMTADNLICDESTCCRQCSQS
jgi:2,3-bisphosphoglycerate-independent phosphoglycerate mutase